MAILNMKRISIAALKKDEKRLMDTLQQMGVVQLETISSEESDLLQNPDTHTQQSLCTSNLNLCKQAIAILSSYANQKPSFFDTLQGKKVLTHKEYLLKAKQEDVFLCAAKDIVEKDKEIARLSSDKNKPKSQIDELQFWQALPVPMNFKGTKSTRAFIGMLPGGYTLEKLFEDISKQNASLQAYDASIISVSPTQTRIFLLCLAAYGDAMEEALRSIGFAYPVHSYAYTPHEQQKLLEEQIKKLQQRIDSCKHALSAYTKNLHDLEYLADYYAINLEKYTQAENLLTSQNAFFLEGYILEKNASKTIDKLKCKFSIAYTLTDPRAEDDTPVAIQNHAFATPVESVLASFSYPGKGEIDPTEIMAIFYYFFFGLMLADAGYGILMILGCFIAIKKFQSMPCALKRTLEMFLYCGITTTFWGVMFGSYFGDAIPLIASHFFGKTITVPALWFVPLEDPMRLLVYSMAFGLLHLTVGLILGGIQALRAKDYKSFLYDTLLWFGLVYALVILLLPSSLFRSLSAMTIILPTWVVDAAGKIAVLCALGIILTAGRDSRNWFKRILKGIYGLYNISGWLSDVLSYSRLLALGLASGVIASVINQMGTMTGTSPLGIFFFIIIFLFGHLFNIAINLLGAYVHTNRLQFVEFFGKFYSGGGKPFKPFAADTQYYTIQEES